MTAPGKPLDLDGMEAVARAAEKSAPGSWCVEDPMDTELSIVQADKPTHEWRFIAHCPLPDEEEHEAFTGGEIARLAKHIATFDPPTVLKLIEELKEARSHSWSLTAEQSEAFAKALIDPKPPAERLRIAFERQRAGGLYPAPVLMEAADAERLIQMQRELVGALKPFAALADVYAPQEDDAHPVWKDWDVLDRRFAEFTVGAARQARAAITKALGEQPL